jgi:hypothetical protein
MSVIVVSEQDSDCLRWTLECLKAQTVASALECILVTKRGGLDGLGLTEYPSTRLLELESLEDPGRAKAAGVTTARAPIVAFVEDHSYPDSSWAEALLRSYEQADYAAVGPVVLNANPGTAASWGCFLVYYGMYASAPIGGLTLHLPGNQSSYRKTVLLEYGARLPDMLQAEIVLQGELIARGMRLWQESSAKVYHLNYSDLEPALREYYLASRVFAGERRRPWSTTRRVVYGLGSPLLPLIRLKRILGQARQSRLPARVTRAAIWPAFLILCVGAAGELLGYLLGSGGAKKGLMRFEREHATLFSQNDLDEIRNRDFRD